MIEVEEDVEEIVVVVQPHSSALKSNFLKRLPNADAIRCPLPLFVLALSSVRKKKNKHNVEQSA